MQTKQQYLDQLGRIKEVIIEHERYLEDLKKKITTAKDEAKEDSQKYTKNNETYRQQSVDLSAQWYKEYAWLISELQKRKKELNNESDTLREKERALTEKIKQIDSQEKKVYNMYEKAEEKEEKLNELINDNKELKKQLKDEQCFSQQQVELAEHE